MLTLCGPNHRDCTGLARREFLRVGGLGLAGLTLADLLRNETRADSPPSRKSLIYIVLGGLEDEVLGVVLGEFGRTPRISQPGPGREHWADAGCAVFFGGGLKAGVVVGETDSRGERARTGATTFQNVIATIYTVLGIDPKATLSDFTGRPQFLLDDSKPIKELFD